MTVDVTAIFLAVAFVLVSCLGLNQLYRVAISKHNKYSLRAGILLFLTLGAVIRVLFWIKVCIIQFIFFCSSFPVPRSGGHPNGLAESDHGADILRSSVDAVRGVRICPLCFLSYISLIVLAVCFALLLPLDTRCCLSSTRPPYPTRAPVALCSMLSLSIVFSW